MSNKRNTLIDVVTRLCRLLERPDLTDYERQRYQDDFLKLSRKCLTASDFSNERELQIGLDSAHKAPQQKIRLKWSAGHQTGLLALAINL